MSHCIIFHCQFASFPMTITMQFAAGSPRVSGISRDLQPLVAKVQGMNDGFATGILIA